MGQVSKVNGDYRIKTSDGSTITLDTGLNGHVLITGTLSVTGGMTLTGINGNSITTGVISNSVIPTYINGKIYNGLNLSANTNGFSILGGITSTKTLTVNNTITLSGDDNSTLSIGLGGSLGTAAFMDATSFIAASGTLRGILKGAGLNALTSAIPGTDYLNSSSSLNASNISSGTVPAVNGGTGLSYIAANNVLLGNGTGSLQAVAPGTSGNVLTSNGVSWISAAPTGGGGGGGSSITDLSTNAGNYFLTSTTTTSGTLISSYTFSTKLYYAQGTGILYTPSLNITNTTASTNTITGALVVGGGIGVGGNVNATAFYGSGIGISSGTIALSAINATGVTNNTTFLRGDGVWSPLAPISIINDSVYSGTEYLLSARSTISPLASVYTSISALTYVPSTGILSTPALSVTNTTTSTSTSTGALLVAGGIGVTGDVFANSFNGLNVTENTSGFSLTGGITNNKILTVNNTLTLSGTDSSTLNIGTGGTLGTAAYTNSTAYQTPIGTFTTALLKGTGSANAIQQAVAGTDYLLPTGNGSGLTSLNASNISSGTIGNSFIPSALTGKTYNGLSNTANPAGFSIAGGTTISKTLTVNNTLALSGTDSSTLNIGTGGTLGTAAFTAASAYQPVLPTGSSGQVLLGNGTTSPTWSTFNFYTMLELYAIALG